MFTCKGAERERERRYRGVCALAPAPCLARAMQISSTDPRTRGTSPHAPTRTDASHTSWQRCASRTRCGSASDSATQSTGRSTASLAICVRRRTSSRAPGAPAFYPSKAPGATDGKRERERKRTAACQPRPLSLPLDDSLSLSRPLAPRPPDA